MEAFEHIAAISADGASLADAAARAGWDAPVPTCPDWRVRDLVAHVGGVHRWAAGHVAGGLVEQMPGAQVRRLFDSAPGDGTLLDWFTDGYTALVAALREATDDLECWTFLPARSSRAFWARRQAHETGIHRVDAQRAAGPSTAPDARLAADGIDELLTCFLTRPAGRLRADPARTLAVRAEDLDEEWLVHVGPERVETIRGPGASDCALSGPASDLYLMLWNRADAAGLRVDGDASVLDLWRDRAQVLWSR